jgi:hypothetical protein
MRRRGDHLWAVCGFALIALLALAFHPELASRAATGMSAPSAPRTSIESAPLDRLLPTHFDGQRSAQLVCRLSFGFFALLMAPPSLS